MCLSVMQCRSSAGAIRSCLRKCVTEVFFKLLWCNTVALQHGGFPCERLVL